MPKRRRGKGKEFDSSSAVAANSKRRAYNARARDGAYDSEDDDAEVDDNELDAMASDMDVQGASSAASSSAGADNVYRIQLVSGEHVIAALADDFDLIGVTIAVPNSTWPGYSGGASKCHVHGFARETSVGAAYIVSCVAYPDSHYALTLQTMASLHRKKVVQPTQTAKRKLEGELDHSFGTAAASAHGVVP